MKDCVMLRAYRYIACDIVYFNIGFHYSVILWMGVPHLRAWDPLVGFKDCVCVYVKLLVLWAYGRVAVVEMWSGDVGTNSYLRDIDLRYRDGYLYGCKVGAS